MPKNVGRYQQGHKLTQPADEPHTSGMPHRAAPAGPVPKNQPAERDPIKYAPNNDARKP